MCNQILLKWYRVHIFANIILILVPQQTQKTIVVDDRVFWIFYWK